MACVPQLIHFSSEIPQADNLFSSYIDYSVQAQGLPVIFGKDVTLSFKISEGNELFLNPSSVFLRSVVQVVSEDGTEVTEEKDNHKFSTCDALGLMMFSRFELISKGKLCDKTENAGLSSYILTKTNLPHTYLTEQYKYTVGYFGEEEPAKWPNVLTASTVADYRRAILGYSTKLELLSPVNLTWFQTSRLIPTQTSLLLNVTLQVCQYFFSPRSRYGKN